MQKRDQTSIVDINYGLYLYFLVFYI